MAQFTRSGAVGPATYNALVSGPQLKDFLQTYPAILRWAISQAWRLEWPEADYQPQAEELAAAMLTRGRLAEVVASLPTPAVQALRHLLAALLRYLRSASGRPLPPRTVERLKKLAGKAPSKAKG